MTSIKGYADILLMGAAGSLSEQQKHFLNIIQSNADRLSILVNDLLDISRIELGRDVLTLQPLNLEEIVDKVLERYQTLANQENKSISFDKDLPADLPRVFGDYERVGQVLNNLIDNAYRYNVENGSICIHANKVNSHVQIEIQDTGVGIPSNELSSVFERFFRGETPLNLGVSGTGLGLSIVKNWVEMHQGQIWAESSGISGEGTKVTFTLPEYNPHN
jgi:signal transduction histidine kinase